MFFFNEIRNFKRFFENDEKFEKNLKKGDQKRQKTQGRKRGG